MIYTVFKVETSIYITLGFILLGILLYSLVVSIQLPYCFKYGYAKAKFITILLPILIGFGVPSVAFIAKKFWGHIDYISRFTQGYTFLTSNFTSLALICILLSTAFLSASYFVSLKIGPSN